MANFYKDNSDILFHMHNMDLKRIIQLKEKNFIDKDDYADAPHDVAEASDNYSKVLEIVGEIAGDFIAPRAPAVDKEEAQFVDGEVHYARGTQEAIDRLTKSDLMGFTLPRQYGGLNLPKSIYVIAIEMISRADAALMNIFGLQEIAETIYRFGSDEQKQRYLPRFCKGEVLGSMALTEPDAGSDLQAVSLAGKLSVTQKDDGNWYLNGVKRFITNGNAQISLVMARSEADVSGGRGISLFIYERDKHMRIRRIEEKYGMHGSPTCEMQFNEAPAELLGKRKFGLIKYTMALMNGARLAVAAQAIGIAEAAYREASAYAAKRVQFGKPICELTAVCEMLTDMKVAIEAGRSFLYETARIVDLKENIEEAVEQYPELQNDLKRYTKYAALFTPALKAYATEMGNKVCYDALQVHGGSGYTKDYNIERHVRDVRVTNIYEGTTQLQVLAAVGGVVNGVIFERLDDYEKEHDFSAIKQIFEGAKLLRSYVEAAVAHIKEKGDKSYQEYHERRLVEIGNDAIMSYLLCIDALKSESKQKSAKLFIGKAIPRCKSTMEYILSDDKSFLELKGVCLDIKNEI
jgi:3-(methylthio)propanoyl-CoA dehydrogenase